MSENENKPTANFIRKIVAEDKLTGKHGGKVVTRFPPEPNGYLHIGHAKSICINFGIAEENGGQYHLRFDDTNPKNEDVEYVDAIKEDIAWLGFDWGKHLYFASDYFDRLYEMAVKLIKLEKAFVCELSSEEMREYRGTLTEPGKNSPYRDRAVEENLDLFERMKNGEFEEGKYTLRVKIDMSSGNINLRDPVIYRVLNAHHHRAGDKWCIYPMYDFTHGLSDSFEGITHSICTLEFQDHRPLYDWFIDVLKCDHQPQQIEFSKLFLNYTAMSKRNLRAMVEEGITAGWDDPRMPTLRGFRRHGFTPRSIRNFVEGVGVSKKETIIDMSILEDSLRNDLNEHAARAMAVLKPLKLVIEDYPEGKTEELDAPNHPQKPEMGKRKIPFSREVFIEQEDFMEDPPGKFFRLAPGKEVRLRYSYVIKCEKVIKDKEGNVIELRCSHDPKTLGNKPEGRKVKGILHWVSSPHAFRAEVRVYDRLFNHESPGRGGVDFREHLNPNSLEVLTDCALEPSLKNVEPETHFQFERMGYFVSDRVDSKPGAPIFNRASTLRDTWAKINK